MIAEEKTQNKFFCKNVEKLIQLGCCILATNFILMEPIASGIYSQYNLCFHPTLSSGPKTAKQLIETHSWGLLQYEIQSAVHLVQYSHDG